MNISDRTLLAVLSALLRDIKEKALNQVFPIYLPENIDIPSKGLVRFKSVKAAVNLQRSLYYLGATVYHLAAGASEYNQESFCDRDGYNNNPLDSIYWPVIEYLLSGSAFSIPEIERRITKRALLKRSARNMIVSPLVGFEKISGQALSRIAEFFWSIINKAISDKAINITCGVITLCMCVVEIIFYISFNYLFTANMAIFWLSTMFVVFVVLICKGNIHSRFEGSFFYVIITIMMLYAATSFMSLTKQTNRSGIVINRQSGEFVAIFKNNVYDDSPIAWRNYWIDHFKYKVIPGLPTQGSISRTLAIKDEYYNKSTEIKLTADFSIQKNKPAYSKYLKKYGTESGFRSALTDWMTKAQAELEKEFHLELSKAAEENMSLSYIDFLYSQPSFVVKGTKLIQQKEDKIKDALLQRWKKELLNTSNAIMADDDIKIVIH